MSEPTAKELIEGMPQKFQSDLAIGEECSVQISLSGEGGGDWCVIIKDGTCSVTSGINPDADATMKASATDYIAINTGKLGGMQAVLTGKMKLSGNQGVLMKFQKWFA